MGAIHETDDFDVHDAVVHGRTKSAVGVGSDSLNDNPESTMFIPPVTAMLLIEAAVTSGATGVGDVDGVIVGSTLGRCVGTTVGVPETTPS